MKKILSLFIIISTVTFAQTEKSERININQRIYAGQFYEREVDSSMIVNNVVESRAKASFKSRGPIIFKKGFVANKNSSITASITKHTQNSTGNDFIVEKTDNVLIYPNPFDDILTINYSVFEKSKVLIIFFDSNGTIKKLLDNEIKEIGTHTLDIDGTNFSSGIYFYSVKTSQYVINGKVIKI